MTREQAVTTITMAQARRPYGTAEQLVAALEGLGLIKFDEKAPTMHLDEQVTALEALGLLTFEGAAAPQPPNMTPSARAYWSEAGWLGPPPPSVARLDAARRAAGLRNAETPPARRVPRYPSRTPAEILGDVSLGTGSHAEQWLVGRGPNGSDRLIEALTSEGFAIVKVG